MMSEMTGIEGMNLTPPCNIDVIDGGSDGEGALTTDTSQNTFNIA